jgi:hypothetical protein
VVEANYAHGLLRLFALPPKCGVQLVTQLHVLLVQGILDQFYSIHLLVQAHNLLPYRRHGLLGQVSELSAELLITPGLLVQHLVMLLALLQGGHMRL